jgi:hypothetical protein
MEAEMLNTLIKAALALIAAAILAGCNADCASPFEAPDQTTQPVTCVDSGCAK